MGKVNEYAMETVLQCCWWLVAQVNRNNVFVLSKLLLFGNSRNKLDTRFGFIVSKFFLLLFFLNVEFVCVS